MTSPLVGLQLPRGPCASFSIAHVAGLDPRESRLRPCGKYIGIRRCRPTQGDHVFASIVAAEGGYQEFVLGSSEMLVLWLSVAAALVALLLHDLGVRVPPRFGYAPSTPSPELAA